MTNMVTIPNTLSDTADAVIFSWTDRLENSCGKKFQCSLANVHMYLPVFKRMYRKYNNIIKHGQKLYLKRYHIKVINWKRLVWKCVCM